MISSVTFFFKVLIALTLLSGSCIETSMAFTAPVAPSSSKSSAFTTNAGRLSSSCLASTVIESPPVTKSVELIKKKMRSDQEEKKGGDGWEIQLFNDPFNHRTFVAKCLSEICGKSDPESYQIMMQAHKNGMGVIGRYHLEIAELYFNSLKAEGLTVQLVEVDDE